MPNAITLSYENDEETSGVPDEEGVVATPFDDDTGDFFDTLIGGGAQLLSSIMGGGGGGGAKPSGGGGIGESLGMIAGAGLGTLAGGAGASIGANLGKMAGGAVENLVRTQVKKKPKPGKPQRKLTKRERKILADGEQMTKRTGDPMYAQEARLRVYRPAEYKRKRDAGQLLSQILAGESESEALQEPPQHRPRLNFGAMTNAPRLKEPETPYDDTASPDTRPRPLQHVSASPMSAAQLEAMIRAVPLLRMHDPRLLRTLTGGGGAREVSGVDPTRGTYQALPGETPHGIAKKLTGQTERTQELLAANPGKPESDPVWNIPPGWLHYAGDTGATLITARKYVVLKDDWPQKIATKLGACPARVKWWSELKAANPHKPTQSGSGNWVSLFAGEEIGIPDVWPEHPLAVSINTAPAQPSTPGVPAPGKTTTLDPAVVPHTQALLASWALRNPSDCNPSDFGRNPMDLVSGFTPRTTQALASFQTWWNKKQPTRPLSTTGELDQATYNALVEESNASGPLFQTVPSGETTTTQQTQESASPPPPPSAAPSAGLPPGVSVQASTKPGHVLVVTPMGNFDLPATPGSTPGTVVVDVPLLGKREIPAPAASQQPPPAAPSAGLPPGVSVQASTKPGHVLVVTPMGNFDLPATPGSTPGTVVVDVPLLGKREIPAPAASQQQSTTSPPPLPPPPAAPSAGLPPGVSVQASTKPGHVLVVTPMGNFDLPASPGSKPGTVIVDVPLLGKHEIPAPTASQQSPGQPEPSKEIEEPPNGEVDGGSPTPKPKLDDTFSESAKQDLLLFLEACDNPWQLEEVAQAYELSGYPLAAKALRDRARVLRQQQSGGAPPTWEYYPQTDTAPPSPTGSSSNGSLLPVIAVVAAGLAFS